MVANDLLYTSQFSVCNYFCNNNMSDKLVHQAWISLGSNLGDRAAQLALARNHLAESCGTILRVSGIYESRAWGYESDNMFFNQCLQLETALSPGALLQAVLEVERRMGRQRGREGYTDRSIDLDILFYDNLVLQTDHLQVPHPRMEDRRFVLQPLQEIASGKQHPVTGLTVGEMLEKSTDTARIEKIFP
jgi:2-amino-4-hydroxy-6-hydroxymethyldihydropteridine diphosphokinase